MKSCSLCDSILPLRPIVDEGKSSCCHGCQAVFSILSLKGQAGTFRTHPLFLQAVNSGLISNPHLLEQLNEKRSREPLENCHKIYFEIQEMWCPSCAEVIRLICMQHRGVKHCFVDYATDVAVVEFFPQQVSKKKIFQLISSLGYSPKNFEEKGQMRESRQANWRLSLASFFSLNVMMFSYPLYAAYFSGEDFGYEKIFAYLSFAASLPVVTYCAWPIFRRFLSALSVGVLGMEALVTLGVTVAFALSSYELWNGGTKVYFDSMSAIVTFVLLGKKIENRAKFSAKTALFRLNLSLPKRIRQVGKNGAESYVPAKEIQVGNWISVRMGETIPVDGLVVSGEGVCNEALMTGEPIPVLKKNGSVVIGGSIVQQGHFVVEATSLCHDSFLQRIIGMIESDIGNKSSYVRKADLWVRWFVPLTFAIAAATAVFWAVALWEDPFSAPIETALFRALTVILISCPCALGIAVPLAESHLIDRMASFGIVVRNRGVLNFLGRENVVAFDKTGCLTVGKFELISGLEKLSTQEKSILSSMVAHSNHPVAIAVATATAGEERVCLSGVQEFVGNGIEAYCGEERYFFGSEKYLKRQGVVVQNIPKKESGIATVVYFAKKGSDSIALELGDRLRPSASKAVEALKAAELFLLSGDGEDCVKSVAKESGVSHWMAQMSPLDKQNAIQKFKDSGKIVCMVGDGINDSPALTAAHVGVSVVTATDISIQVSDVLLATDDLTAIPMMRAFGAKGRKIIKQNLFWAFFYNGIGMGLAAFGMLSPLFAAFAMVVSSIIVVLNSRRI